MMAAAMKGESRRWLPYIAKISSPCNDITMPKGKTTAITGNMQRQITV